MIFKVKLENKCRSPFEVPGILVLWGGPAENPDENIFRPLVLIPREEFTWETDDVNHEFARFSSIIYRENKVDGGIFLDLTERKNWKEHDPTAGKRWVVDFVNETEASWAWKSSWAGNYEVSSGIPKRITVSPLSPFARFKTIKIVYKRRINQETRSLEPRVAIWQGHDLRSPDELREITALKKDIMAEYKLREDVAQRGAGTE